MKTGTMFASFSLKIFLALGFIIGLTSLTKIDAQNIIGKWKGVSVKNYYSADFAKTSGKTMDERSAKETGASTIDYKADHTFIMTFTSPNDTAVTTMNGTWSLAGDQLKFTVEKQYNPKSTTTTATISITGNTLIMTAIMPAPSRISKSISTCARI